jgi:hypothetical protein
VIRARRRRKGWKMLFLIWWFRSRRDFYESSSAALISVFQLIFFMKGFVTVLSCKCKRGRLLHCFRIAVFTVAGRFLARNLDFCDSESSVEIVSLSVEIVNLSS